jgi:anti-anti-sigma factor
METIQSVFCRLRISHVSKLLFLWLYVSCHRPPSAHVFINIQLLNQLEAGVQAQCSAVGSMKLQIEQRDREKIVILDLKGRLVVGDEDFSLLQRLLRLLESRRRKIVLNCKDVSDIDGTGLDTIAFCAVRFQDAGGRLVLLNLPQAHLAQSHPGIDTYQQEADAVNSFFLDRVVPRYDILEFVKEQQQLRDQLSGEAGPALAQ